MKNEDRYINPFILDNPIRSIILPPKRILSRFVNYLKEDYVIVDLGCGPGFFTTILAKYVPKGTIYAVDPDERAIKKLKEKIQRSSMNNVIPAVAPAQKLDFIRNSSVDFVFSNLVLCCMVDHEGAVKEMIRILKKDNGMAYISVTRTFFGQDKRDVNPKEWKNILANFIVIKDGVSLTERWALVKTKSM